MNLLAIIPNDDILGSKVPFLFPLNSVKVTDGTDEVFIISKEEARALEYLLKLHHGLMKQHEEQYIHILRLINGLDLFLNEK